MFALLFVPRCTPHLSHLSETEAGSLNGVCYMWWDEFPFLALAGDPNLPMMQETAQRTMARILRFKSLACQESALHGLGHWQRDHDRQASAIIDGFLAANPEIDTRLVSYANSVLRLRALGWFIIHRSVNWLHLRLRAFLEQAHQFSGESSTLASTSRSSFASRSRVAVSSCGSIPRGIGSTAAQADCRGRTASGRRAPTPFVQRGCCMKSSAAAEIGVRSKSFLTVQTYSRPILGTDGLVSRNR